MFKKLGTVVVLSTTLLFGGAFHSSVDAAANAAQSENKIYSKTAYIKINGYVVDHAWLSEFFNRYQLDWKSHYTPQAKSETPKVEVPKEVETPKQEQPKAEAPKNEQPKANEPVIKEEPKTEERNDQVTEKTEQEKETSVLSQFEQEVVNYTNDERAKNGLAPLEVDVELSRVAREKSQDMATKGYFAHQSPTYGSPFDMMQAYGISYRTAGENIAKGQQTPAEVVQAWMNSEGHRANILNGNFTHIGVGFVEQGNHWTQQFIGR